MTKKLALVLLASLLFGVVIVQPVKSQFPENLQPSATPMPSPSPPPSPSPTPSQSSSPTEQPTSTPELQPTPPSPWELILVVFASVTLTALVITAAQKLRARSTAK